MPTVVRKSVDAATGTPYWILKGVSDSWKPRVLRAKLTITDLTHDVHDDEPDRTFKLEVMDDAHHPSTPFHSAGNMLYNGPHHEEMLSILKNTFMQELEFGDTTATREHLISKLDDKL
jgi:hypothetical protein